MINDSNQDIFTLTIDNTSKAHLLETARWTKFLSVLGFIYIGLGLVFCLGFYAFMNALMSKYGGGGYNTSGIPPSVFTGMMVIYWVVISGIYFYPIFALYKFSRLIKPAVLTNNQEGFNNALGYLKGCFKYIGILMIIGLVFTAVIIMFALAMGLTSM